MTEEQTKALEEAWKLRTEIVAKMAELALMNETIAFGCVKYSEAMITAMLNDRIARTMAEKPVAHPEHVEGAPPPAPAPGPG